MDYVTIRVSDIGDTIMSINWFWWQFTMFAVKMVNTVANRFCLQHLSSTSMLQLWSDSRISNLFGPRSHGPGLSGNLKLTGIFIRTYLFQKDLKIATVTHKLLTSMVPSAHWIWLYAIWILLCWRCTYWIILGIY